MTLKEARKEAAAIVASALDKRVEELKRTDAFKAMKAEIEHFEDNGNPDNLRVDGENLISSERIFVPRELCADGDIELIENLLRECSDVLHFHQDDYSQGYFEWVMEQSYGEPVIFNESPERNCYAIYSDELGLKIDRVIDEEHGYIIIETAMREHGVFGSVVSTDSCGFAFERAIPKHISNATDTELAEMLARKTAPKFIIQDWAGNVLFDGREFPSFEDAWGFIYDTFPDQDEDFYGEYYVEEVRK